MSYVRNCESDVFISYAHFDNEPMFEGQRGWVEVFHRALEVRLRQLLGEDPAVWRDLSLEPEGSRLEAIDAKSWLNSLRAGSSAVMTADGPFARRQRRPPGHAEEQAAEDGTAAVRRDAALSQVPVVPG